MVLGCRWGARVLAVVNESMNLSFDDPLFHANDSQSLRLLPGLDLGISFRYARQTLVNNVTTLPSLMLAEISQLVVEVGKRIVGKIR